MYVDATAYLRLAPAGREVVLAHELTHLATGAASDPKVPVWLEEGFADYIGFLGAQIDVRTAAHAAISQVHAVGPPTGLPRDEDFAATGPALAVAYAEGWLMCRWFAQAYSQAALVEVYHRVAHGGTSLAGAVERVTGRPLADAVAGWAAYVTALAR